MVGNPKRWIYGLMLIALIVPVIAACGPQPAAQPTAAPAQPTAASAQPTAPASELASLSGDIIIDGSSTVYPPTAAAAEEFSRLAPNVRVSVGISGTGGGFKKFCNGETDISNASRPIREEEQAICAQNGIEFIELPVAYDGLSVVVNPQNDWVTCLTVAELKKIWEPAAQGVITNWNQVREGFPNRPLVLLGAGTDSGTFDYFTEAIVGEAKASRGDYQATEDDNVTITGVSGDLNAMGYLGYAYVVENQGKIKPIAIDNGNGCVEPSFETIADASYQPLSRPLFIYVNKEAAERPEVQAFVNFYLSPEFTPIIQTPQVGYVKLSDELYAAIAKRFNDRVLGTMVRPGEEVGLTLDRYLTGEMPPLPSSAPTFDYATLSGDIIIDGSSTVYPPTAAAAEEFSRLASNVRVSVGISGTGGGFKKFCNGETDISNASRPIREEEQAICAQNGIEFIELPVAYDGLSVVVNPQNDWATCLTVAELKKIWEPAAQGVITNWNQVREGFPDRPLVLLGAGTDSGTFDYFTEAIVGEAKASRGDYQATEDDNVTITGVSGDLNAMGYLGYAYVVENQGKIKPIAVDNGNGCVEPSFETIADATYQPLSRPLFIYVNKEAAERPEVQAFVNFYLSPEFTPIIQTPQVGYVKLSDELYAAIARRFNDRVVGTLVKPGEEVGLTLDRYLGK
ncbi:PstS family phosphate ABC transporter substrate-binding protein [Chloroflexus sp.]|uniref:PstS family phosphate ABC transporter substrate-binding protein n=1 Tax=Chloroflexus sp. TaxID=1904827 RepID=UPI00257972AE|nr:PstS family phosphate ABC transporter substrate-binding protein [Chloroflexus sp.]